MYPATKVEVCAGCRSRILRQLHVDGVVRSLGVPHGHLQRQTAAEIGSYLVYNGPKRARLMELRQSHLSPRRSPFRKFTYFTYPLEDTLEEKLLGSISNKVDVLDHILLFVCAAAAHVRHASA